MMDPNAAAMHPGPAGMGISPMITPAMLGMGAGKRKKTKDQKARTAARKRKAVEDSKPVLARQKVLLTRMFGTADKGIMLMEYAGIDVDGAPIVEGFPSVGLLSVIVAKTLIQELDLPLIGVVAAPDFPVGCTVTKGQPTYPVRIFGDKRLVVFSCDFKLAARFLHFFVEALLDFAKRHDSPMIYGIEGKPDFDELEKVMSMMMGGSMPSASMMPPMPSMEFQQRLMPAPVPFVGYDASLSESDDESCQSSRSGDDDRNYYSEEASKRREEKEKKKKRRKEKIHFLTTSDDTAARLRELQAYPIIEGNIDGVTGGLLAVAPTTDKHVTAILAKASSMYPDARSAARVLKLLLQLIPSLPDVDTSYLEEEATELEESLMRLSLGSPSGDRRKPFGMYN